MRGGLQTAAAANSRGQAGSAAKGQRQVPALQSGAEVPLPVL